MLSFGSKFYHQGWDVIIWDAMLSSGANVIIWSYCYHLEQMFLCGRKRYHLELLLSSWANVIIWCYHVMLSSGMITPPIFIFPGNFTHSICTPHPLPCLDLIHMIHTEPDTDSLGLGAEGSIKESVTQDFRVCFFTNQFPPCFWILS